MILGLDVSHYQQGANFAAIKASGRDFVVIKATEGSTYVDPMFSTFRQQAHAAGLIVGIYHFGRAGNVGAEASWFIKTVGALQPGEFLVFDQEVANTAGWCKTWLDTVAAATHVNPLIYMNTGSVTGVNAADWSQVASTYGLWLAKYDNAPAVLNTVPYWGTPAMKQYSDKGTVPGVPGTCDVDAFYGTADQLRAYGYQGSTDVLLTPTDLDAIWNYMINGVRARDRVEGVDRVQLPALAKAVGDIHGKVVDSQLDLSNRPQDRPDDLLGHVLSAEARVRDLAASLAGGSLDPVAFANALAGNAQAMQVFAAALAPVLAKALGTNLANG